jgi:TolA-binding protein
MATGGWLRQQISRRLLLCLAVLMVVVGFGVYKYAGKSLPPGGDAVLHDQGDNPVHRLNQVNQQLSTRISALREELRLTTEERDRLKEDKAQLLYMVEKLQQQSVKASAGSREGGVSAKVVRSWLVRLSELRTAGVAEKAAARDEYVKEVNEVIRGLKEDFVEDTFIMGIGYAKTSSLAKGDILAAQKKLDDIIKYLQAYNNGAG